MKQNEFIEQESKEISILPKITTKQWEDAEGSETSAELRKGEITRIGTYGAEILDAIHDGNKRHAILWFEGKNSIKTDLFENGRYDLGNGYYIFIKAIVKNPEEVVLLYIKGKTQ